MDKKKRKMKYEYEHVALGLYGRCLNLSAADKFEPYFFSPSVKNTFHKMICSYMYKFSNKINSVFTNVETK